MDVFYKAIGMVMITVILGLFLGRWEKDTASLLSIAGCCIAASVLAFFLDPVVLFLRELEDTAGLQNGLLSSLLKAAGIAVIAEIAGLICSDAGNGALSKMVQLLGSAAILFICIPIFQSLLQLLMQILGAL